MRIRRRKCMRKGVGGGRAGEAVWGGGGINAGGEKRKRRRRVGKQE